MTHPRPTSKQQGPSMTDAQKTNQKSTFSLASSPAISDSLKSRSENHIVAQLEEKAIAKYLACSEAITESPWLRAFLSLVFLALTVIYAFSPESVSRSKVIGGSPTSALRVLKILSDIAGVMLYSTLSAAFDHLQYYLLSKECGGGELRFLVDLILPPTSGVLDLINVVALRRGIKMATRFRAVVSLTLIFFACILSILVTSDVGTKPVFYGAETTPIYGYSIGAFNASIAEIWPVPDLLFLAGVSEFLSDSSRVVDITEAKYQQNCSFQYRGGSVSDCKSTFFVPGPLETGVRQDLESIASTKYDVYLALDQQGYVFEFGIDTQEWTYESSEECHVYGFGKLMLSLCLKNSIDQAIQAHLGLCPRDLSSGICLNSTGWRSGNGWRTSLRTSHRRATVAYSRFDGTILSLELSNSPATPTMINATDLLHAFDIFLRTNDSILTVLESSFTEFGSRTLVHPYILWWYLGITTPLLSDTGANARAVHGLQSLLGFTIYHCQAKKFADLGRGLEYDNRSSMGRKILSLFPTVEPDTAILPAIQRHKIIVGRATLVAYIVVGGFVWLLGIVAILLGSCSSTVRTAKYSTYFPTPDSDTNPNIELCGQMPPMTKRYFAVGKFGIFSREGRSLYKVAGREKDSEASDYSLASSDDKSCADSDRTRDAQDGVVRKLSDLNGCPYKDKPHLTRPLSLRGSWATRNWTKTLSDILKLPKLSTTFKLGRLHHLEYPLQEGKQRIRWTCGCGVRLYDDFVELQPGALARLKDQLDQSEQALRGPNGSSESTRELISYLLSSLLGSAGKFFSRGWPRSSTELPFHRPPKNTIIVEGTQAQQETEIIYFLLCINNSRYGTRLYHESVSDIETDKGTFTLLRSTITRKRNRLLSFLSVRTVTRISLSKFTLDMSLHVDVHPHQLSCKEISCTCIPPPEKVEPSASCEYRCKPVPAAHVPPIGENYLMHCYSSPNCVNPSQKWVYNQIPKKLGKRLQGRDDRAVPGWGIHCEEGWNWDKILVLELIIVVLGILFGVLWSLLKHDIQGAFAISAYWLVGFHSLLGLVLRHIV